MNGVAWQTDPEEAFTNLFDAYAQAVFNAVFVACQRRAPAMENWMKANAPWTDRTGNARQTLKTEVVPALAEIIIYLRHGMTYGFWLETKNAGRYAIISPAIDHWLPIILQDIQAVLR